MSESIAYAVRIVRTPKAGDPYECWMANAARHGWTDHLWSAMQFPSEGIARVAAEARSATIARIVPIVALESRMEILP
jgi:hypothetical protein